MNFILSATERYGFNKRALVETDFYLICEAEHIVAKENQDFTAYMVIDGTPCISLGRDFSPVGGLYAKFHELSHHFGCNGENPNQIFFLSGCRQQTKSEVEAHNLAIIAICPIGVLLGEIEFDMEMRDDCGRLIIELRWEIWQDRGV